MKSGADGIFEFPSVRSGRWQVTAEIMRGKIKWMGFTDLTMPRHDVEDARVRLAPPFTLDGVVEGAPQTAHGSVRLSPAENGEESHASLQADGTLHFEDVYPGAYRVREYMQIPGHYLKAILLGTDDVTGKSVHLAPGSAPLRVIFKSNAARVTGTVENGAGVKVVLIEADRERAIDGESMRAAVCDAEGHFTIESLRPTVYYAFAFAIQNVNSGAIEEIVFGARGLGRQAKTLDLSEGETATLDLKVTPWPE